MLFLQVRLKNRSGKWGKEYMELCYVVVHLYLNRALLKSCANATEIQDFSYCVTNFLFLSPPFPLFTSLFLPPIKAKWYGFTTRFSMFCLY